MNLLLDTQAFILWTTSADGLPARATEAVRDGRNRVYVSVASAWEMQIKSGLGKLSLHRSPKDLINFEVKTGGLVLMPVTLEHVDRLSGLPDVHRDPFDRLLIAQAVCDHLTLVSGDAVFNRYPVSVLWE